MKSHAQLEREFNEAINRLEKQHGHLMLEIRFEEAMAIIGALQVVLRHPDFKVRPS